MFKNLRWTIVFLLFMVYMINYLDRVALSITVPMIEQDLMLNAEQFGLIFGSFFFGYAIFNFVGGLAVDRFGPTLVLGVAVGLWSIFCGMTAIATGFYSMLILRVLFGMAEGPICASANKMINGWFPKKQAATAVGLLSAGSPLGGAVAGPIVGYLALAFGWRPAFMIICAIGIVWMLVWFFVVADNPAKSQRVSNEERALIARLKQENLGEESALSDAPHGLGYYLKQPIILVTAFAFFCYILFFFLSWFPSYLVQAHNLNIKEMSLTTMIPWIVGFVGLALGGYISDKIFNITGKLLLSRKIVLVTSLLAAAVCVALAGTVSSVVPAVMLMSVSIFFLYITGALYWAIIQDVVHKSRVGGASGFIHLIGSVSGIIGPIATGYIVQNTGKFDSAFMLAGGVAALGALLVLLVIKAPRATAGVQILKP
ncbi:MFS transporter [Serratia marcescens]|uniref:D-galactarate permease n=1 Tax=Serratia marcescens TaxID=615 RepID=A0A379YWM3_SERMA|nr:MFS transporter [Serratia marcescens]KFD14339.1 D-galactonate transporter [Serratia marcescens subsp. marcescens ATCC 13880]KFL05491.1 sugar (and other) transporter family protein [Serratia marcescens]MCC3250062.1 MFS transporter [Serratia marcescens]PNU43670.1 MFS transporter [Serratia marcescens subsp. marcescens ATCC 13880]QDL86619.1 MFS transporter [Serratia marcescens subsp. marcescens ATCC 13880]